MVFMDLRRDEYVELAYLNTPDASQNELRRNMEDEIRRKLISSPILISTRLHSSSERHAQENR
jgi:hypothetical protein